MYIFSIDFSKVKVLTRYFLGLQEITIKLFKCGWIGLLVGIKEALRVIYAIHVQHYIACQLLTRSYRKMPLFVTTFVLFWITYSFTEADEKVSVARRKLYFPVKVSWTLIFNCFTYIQYMSHNFRDTVTDLHIL